MKILHTSDWHLGRSLHGASLRDAFTLWTRHVTDTVRDLHIDALLIAGDIYDRAVPPSEMVTLLSRTLSELASLTTVIITSGNHDSPQRLGFGADLMREGIHIRTDARQCGNPVEVTAAGGERALIYPIPYLDPDVARHDLAAEEPLERSHEAVMRAALGLIRESIEAEEPAAGGPTPARIIMTHEFVSGAQESDSERDISVGGIGAIPASLFRLGEQEGIGPIDYVALGHIHSPQRIGAHTGAPLMRYSGSPIAFSFSETAPKQSVLLELSWGEANGVGPLEPVTEVANVDPLAEAPEPARAPAAVGPTGGAGAVETSGSGTAAPEPADEQPGRAGRPTVRTRLIPAPVWRPIATIRGSLAEILGPAHIADREKFVKVEVTDASRPREMNPLIRQAFPHALDVQHRPPAASHEKRIVDVKRENPLDVLKEFLIQAGGEEAMKEELIILRQAVEASRGREQ